MNRRNFRLLTTLALLGGAQMHIGCAGLEYAARAAVLGTLACNEAGVDENDEAAICEARKRADAERADCAQNISCKHEWRDVIEAWEDQRAHISEASRK
jgi:hypothetical protein